MKKLEKMAEKALTFMIGVETYGLPPVCIGMIYQPERPQVKPEKCEGSEGREGILAAKM